MSEHGIMGYYRYTDIVFEWPGRLSESQLYPVKSMINADALTSPGCPLWKDGQEGIELYIGELPNMEQKFLFSIAQIEYIRYYLQETKLVTDDLPLPSSEFLMYPEDFTSVSPIILTSSADLKKILRDLDKHNKKARKGTLGRTAADADAAFALEELAATRGLWKASEKGEEGEGTFLCLDFESWERDSSMITEWGWRGYRWERQPDGSMLKIDECGHFIARDYLSYKNGKFVDDNKMNYTFGKSTMSQTLPEFWTALSDLILRYSTYPSTTPPSSPTDLPTLKPLYLILHDVTSDLKFLTSSASPPLPCPLTSSPLPPTPAASTVHSRMQTIDTQKLYAGVLREAKSGVRQRSLRVMAEDLGVEDVERLHNAGNDAWFTMESFGRMAGSEGKMALLFE